MRFYITIQVIYIAAPPDESNFIRHLIHLIRNEGSFRGYSGDDLTSYLPECYTNDPQVFSSIEQEICSQSEGFLYSPGSSWSLNTAIGKFILMATYQNSRLFIYTKTIACCINKCVANVKITAKLAT